MLYRPQFCCHCGEKIVRAKWTPLTSRRFCDFCAVEQKQHDLLPRAAAVILLIFGAAGITSYVGSSKPVSQPNASMAPKQRADTASTNRNVAPPAPNATPPAFSNARSNPEQLASKSNSSTEPVYYCGALTKKGTACTRRVKSPGRCWQHLGQSAAVDVRK
ncbi:MAG: hypothetical protein DMF63_15275 [Acidobacteria bacterium]|nr:MAG: hypothetical protein DMF63_15275 [Acidobacteriota bacterium]